MEGSNFEAFRGNLGRRGLLSLEKALLVRESLADENLLFVEESYLTLGNL